MLLSVGGRMAESAQSIIIFFFPVADSAAIVSGSVVEEGREKKWENGWLEQIRGWSISASDLEVPSSSHWMGRCQEKY